MTFGLGAGFYVNANQEPWSEHYNMYDYVTQELPGVLASSDLPLNTENCSIMGHSMGGHGALTIALKNPGKYKAVSAFCTYRFAYELPLGEKSPVELYWRQQGGLGTIRCLRLSSKSRRKAAYPGGPGSGR